MSDIKKEVAICFKPGKFTHSGSWAHPWIEYCKQNNISYNLIDGTDKDIISIIKGYDVFLWHFTGFSFVNMLMARSILYSAKAMGLRIFPDFSEAWHFDDKIAENYLLDAIGAPIPNYHIFYNEEDVFKWLEDKDDYPFVAKLKNGSGSHNVKLIRTKKDAIKYTKRMFTKGYDSTPSLAFKASSNLKSSRSISTFINRIKRIPEFVKMRQNASKFPKEKGYVYFQEFIPNDGFDLKVVVVGDKMGVIARKTRKGDFRASGGGDLFYDNTIINQNIVDIAFHVNDKLGFRCMGYDFVIDKNTGEGKIVEISYGFSHTALLNAGGYFDRRGKWHNTPLNAPHEILKELVC